MKIRDKIILRKAFKIFKKTHDKVAITWYLNEKYPKKTGKEIIELVKKVEEMA